MKKGFRILKFKKDKPIFEVKDISKSFDGRPILKKNAAEFDCSLISVSEIEQQSWTSFLYPSPLRIIRADRELLNAYETD